MQGLERRDVAACGGPSAERFPAAQDPRMLSSATGALLAERPQLRFLAWQDESRTNRPRGVFHADGSVVEDSSELRLLKFVDCASLRREPNR